MDATEREGAADWSERTRALAETACRLLAADPRAVRAVVLIVVPAEQGRHDLILSDGELPASG